MTNCPICNGKLNNITPDFPRVFDGNEIFECENNKIHKFWRHPFHYKILHWYPNPTKTNHDWYKSWEYNEGKIIKIEINEKNIGKW